MFGTPWAGGLFAVEVGAVRRFDLARLPLALGAALLGDGVCRGLGTGHLPTPHVTAMPGPLPTLLALPAGLAFGLAALGFVEAVRVLKDLGGKAVARWAPRAAPGVALAVLGGGLVILATLALGTRDLNGLSLPLLSRALNGSVAPWAFAAKLGLTALTLAAGYKGGEVTPLFVVGACLGNALGGPVFAALGMVATFGAAANTPLACVALGVELFGWPLLPALVPACLVAGLMHPRFGIYGAQKGHRDPSGPRDYLPFSRV